MSLPQVGLLGFAGLYALSLTRASRWSAWLGVLSGVVGLALLGTQAFVLRQFCWLCVTVDLASVVAGAAGAWGLLAPRQMAERTPLKSWAWLTLGVLFMVWPALWPSFRPTPPVPAEIRALYRPGKINVVEFADFECPFCRELHGRLKPLLAPYGERVRFVRLNMPLERHVFARDAALAALCVENTPHAEAFVEYLFTTEDLALPALKREVVRLGLPLTGFEGCLTAEQTRKRLDHEIRVLREAGFQGLPTTYIGGRRIVGAQPDDTFRDALERAAQGADERGLPGWAYALLGLAAVLAVVVLGRIAPNSDGA